MSVRGQGTRSAGLSLLVTGLVWTVWTIAADQPLMPPVVVWVAVSLLGLGMLCSRTSRRG